MKNMRPEDRHDVSPETSADALERRRHRRYDAAVEVRFRELCPVTDRECMHIGQTMNICRTGMFIKTNCFYRLGTLLELQVDVLTPDNQLHELKLTGRVAWISFEDALPGMGVEFKDLDEETARALLAHIYRDDLQFHGPDSTD